MKLWFHIYDYDQFDYELILIPKPIGVIYWYSDTQINGVYSLVLWYPTNRDYSLVLWYPTNGGYSLVFWYPNQWGLFIGILIPKPIRVIHWYSDTQPIRVIHWYSDTRPMGIIHSYFNAQSRGYNVTIVIRYVTAQRKVLATSALYLKRTSHNWDSL